MKGRIFIIALVPTQIDRYLPVGPSGPLPRFAPLPVCTRTHTTGVTTPLLHSRRPFMDTEGPHPLPAPLIHKSTLALLRFRI